MNVAANSRPVVIFYRDHLLPYSETFILAQAMGLRAFRPVLAGIRRVQGLDLSRAETVVLNRGGIGGRLRAAAFGYCGMVGEMRRILRQYSPVLIHAHFGPDACRAMPLARSLGVPLIVNYYGYDATIKDAVFKGGNVNWHLYVARRKKLHQAADLFLCVSQFIRDELLSQGFPASKLVVHYTGSDTDYFTSDSQIPREPIVLFVGRLVEKKGCEYLLQAMKAVQQAAPATELVVIGDGPCRPKLETMAKRTLQKYRFLGVQPTTAVRQWMNHAWICCVPSVRAKSGDAEGLPNVVTEAMSMRLPVVGFQSAGIPEAVKHGETGLLAPERSWEQLASHILTLLTDQATWEKFSHAGRRRVCDLFNVETQTAILEDIYSRVLERDSMSKAAKR